MSSCRVSNRCAPVTVITAVHNAEQFLRATVESVLRQAYFPTQHLIIDDASTDSTLELAKQLEREHPHIQVIAHEENRGYPSAINAGIAASATEYVAILDGDDIALPDWLATVLPVLQECPGVGAAGGGCIIMTEHGEVTGSERFCDSRGDVTDQIARGEYVVLHSGTVHRKSVLARVGGYNSHLKSLEDNDVFIGIASVAKIVHTGRPLIYYRRLRKSQSTKTKEFHALMRQFLAEKAKLLSSGKSVSEANTMLAPIVDAMQRVPRLKARVRGSYEMEMANAFELSGRRGKAAKYFWRAMLEGSPPKYSARGILRCVLPSAVVRVARTLKAAI